MVEQLALLNPEQSPAVRVHDPDTSVAPTESAAATGRALALVTLAAHAAGLTDFELAEHTGKAQTSIGKRRGDLVKAGLVEDAGVKRPAPSGTEARVWRLTEAGVKHVREIHETEGSR